MRLIIFALVTWALLGAVVGYQLHRYEKLFAEQDRV